MQQDKLWYEDSISALAQLVAALGGCAAVGRRLWPAKPLKQCETKVANCLNPNHDWKFDLEEIVQILRWGREEGAHFAMHKICEDAGYEPPSIARSKTPEQILAEQMRRVSADYSRLADELAALQSKNLKAVS